MAVAEYRIRRSTRARRVRVTVETDGSVLVTLPRKAPERAAEEAVQELAPWIARRRRLLARAAEELARPAGTVPYLGTTLTLAPQPGRERVAPPRRHAARPRRRPAAGARALLPPRRARRDRAAAGRRHRARRHDATAG